MAISRVIICILIVNSCIFSRRIDKMKDRTLDFKEGLAIIRAYLCTGSREWLDNNEDDSPDVRIIKWGGQLIQLGVCKPGSAKLDTVELGETISNVFKQVKSWVDKRNPDFREEIYNCLGKELRFAVKLLLCEGEQSRENIAVIRQQLLDPFCSGTESFFCRFAMYLTEPETVEMMIPVMKNTSLCQETAGKRRSREINLNVGYRKKRQYDLRTLYDIYSRIFCSPRQDLVAVFDGNDPETFEGMTDGMKLFIVYMRFRGSVCCIADLSNFGYGPGTF